MTHTSPDMAADQYTEILVAELMKTDDFKRVTRSFIHEMMNNWAGAGGLNKWMAPSIEKRMKQSLLGPDTNQSAGDSGTAQDITALAAPLIALTNDLLGRVEKLGHALDEMDEARKEALVASIVAGVNFGKIAALAGPVARTLARIREKHPTFLADILRERLTAWIEGLDFKTAAALLSVSREDLTALSRIVNGALWQSPDRMLEFLTIIPAAINLLTRAAGEFLHKFSKLKIEEITDLFLQLVDRIDGESLGALLNAWAQINRKIMKGTRELRDPNTEIPTSENALMRKVEEIAGNLDPDLVFNLRLTLEDMKVPLREWLMSD
jgi:hypothetical protein